MMLEGLGCALGLTYLPFVLVHEILGRLAAAKEEQSLANLLAVLGLLNALADKATHGSDTGTGTNADDGLGGIRGELEVGVADMDGNVDAVVLVTRTHDFVRKTKGAGLRVTVLLLLESEEVVGGDTAEGIITAGKLGGLDHGGDRDLLGVFERRGRDGVVTRLELGDTLNESREGDVGPLLALADNIQNASDVEMVNADLLVEVILFGAELGHFGLGLRIGSKSSELSDELTGDGRANFHVVANDGVVGSRSREGNLGGGLESLDADNSVALIGETQDVHEAINLLTRVRGPNSDVITGLVVEVRGADIDIHVEAVAVLDGEELVGLGDGGNVRVVSVEWALGGSVEMHLVGFTEIDFRRLLGQVIPFDNAEDGLVNGLALLQAHLLSESLPHGFLPGQEIFLHGTSAIIALASVADAVGTELLESLVDIADHGVVVLIGVVSETEGDIVQVAKRRFVALGEVDILAGNEFVEVHSVIGRLTLTVGGEDEEHHLVVGDSIKILEIVFLKVSNHGLKAKAALALLGESRSVILSSTSLRAVEDDAVLVLLLHLLHDVSCLASLCAASIGQGTGIWILCNAP